MGAKRRVAIIDNDSAQGNFSCCPKVATRGKNVSDDDFDPHSSYSPDRAPVRMSTKKRELIRIKDRLAHFERAFPPADLEEEELIERLNDVVDELLSVIDQ